MPALQAERALVGGIPAPRGHTSREHWGNWGKLNLWQFPNKLCIPFPWLGTSRQHVTATAPAPTHPGRAVGCLVPLRPGRCAVFRRWGCSSSRARLGVPTVDNLLGSLLSLPRTPVPRHQTFGLPVTQQSGWPSSSLMAPSSPGPAQEARGTVLLVATGLVARGQTERPETSLPLPQLAGV